MVNHVCSHSQMDDIRRALKTKTEIERQNNKRRQRSFKSGDLGQYTESRVVEPRKAQQSVSSVRIAHAGQTENILCQRHQPFFCGLCLVRSVSSDHRLLCQFGDRPHCFLWGLERDRFPWCSCFSERHDGPGGDAAPAARDGLDPGPVERAQLAGQPQVREGRGGAGRDGVGQGGTRQGWAAPGDGGAGRGGAGRDRTAGTGRAGRVGQGGTGRGWAAPGEGGAKRGMRCLWKGGSDGAQQDMEARHDGRQE